MALIPSFMYEEAGTAVEPTAAPDALEGDFIAADDEHEPRAPAPPFVPGCFDDMSDTDYHLIEAMSASGAKKMLQSPAHYKLARTEAGADTDAKRFGRAFHIATLEPATYADRVVVAPDVNKRTKAGRETLKQFAAENRGRIILSPAERVRAMRCGDAVRAHPAAVRLLEGATTERSLFWFDGKYKVPCKARLDIWNLGLVADVKTTTDASPEGFARAIASYGYAIQAANYISACEHVLDTSPHAFVFIAVESDAPHAVGVYYLDTADIMFGRGRMDLALERYALALETGHFPGYSERIERISMPAYARRVTM